MIVNERFAYVPARAETSKVVTMWSPLTRFLHSSEHRYRRDTRMTSRVFGPFTALLLVLGLGASVFPARGAEPFLVKDINPSSGSLPGSLQNVNGTLFFSADDGISRRELWMSDGTAAGTVIVKDINPILGTDSDCCFAHDTIGCDDPICEAAVGEQATQCIFGGGPWTSECADLASEVCGTVCARGSFPNQLTNINGTLFFNADDSVGSNNQELWNSDGTQTGTVMVKDINVTGSGSDCCVTHATPGCDDPNSCEVFVCFAFPFCCSDGSVWDDVCAGFAAQVCPICEFGSSANALTNVNGTLFLRADDGINGLELWTSDGTQTGTMLVKDINPGAGGQSVIGKQAIVNGTLFFSAFDGGTKGRELWKSDGTALGTQMILDIASGILSSSPEELTDVNGTLFFRAHDGTDVGIELWKSDGTAVGTVMVKDIHPQFSAFIMPRELTNVDGILFFSANDGMNGSELWRSDGTEAGTVMVKDINPGASSSGPIELTNCNGMFFFRAADSANGKELWKSDGTEAGTVLVKDIRPGVFDSHPDELTVVSGTLFFTANDGTNGKELWMSDGTTAGTVMVADINPGAGFSQIDLLTNVDGVLFFTADDGTTGSELWALQVAPLIVAPPIPATAPHDMTKDRYLSFNPFTNAGQLSALRITRVGSATPWYVSCTVQDAGADGMLSTLVPSAEFCEWTESVIHVRGCEIVPGNEYLVEATLDNVSFSSALSLQTTPPQFIANRQFGDLVGGLVNGAWTAPEGLVTTSDIVAVIQKFQLAETAPHLSRVDGDGETPNGIVASNDILRAVVAFAGGDFSFGVTNCLSGICVPSCP